MRICKPIISVTPVIGSAQSADSRLCKSIIGVTPVIGNDPIVIIYGEAGSISYGSAGEIIY